MSILNKKAQETTRRAVCGPCSPAKDGSSAKASRGSEPSGEGYRPKKWKTEPETNHVAFHIAVHFWFSCFSLLFIAVHRFSHC